ncbi:MAG: hypothetical protein M0Z46_12520 [Actinomycetota bacterium]|jgi:hypothetical protein|nr:hypothetical protein [Actinomycetota bacterium]
MKRTAQATQRLAKALARQGRPVTPRKLERWSLDGLGPTGEAEFSALVPHYAEVALLSTRGRDTDTVALRLAARGYPCERLRGAILRRHGISPGSPAVIPPMLDLSSAPSGDAAFDAIEQLARAAIAHADCLSPILAKLVRAIRRNASQRAVELKETPESIIHSFLVNVFVHLMGGDYYNAQALEAGLGLDSGAIGHNDLALLNSKLHMTLWSLDDACRNIDVDEISRISPRLVSWAPHLLNYFPITGITQEEIEDVVVLIAPAFIRYCALLRDTFPDFPDDPLSLLPPSPGSLAAAS